MIDQIIKPIIDDPCDGRNAFGFKRLAHAITDGSSDLWAARREKFVCNFDDSEDVCPPAFDYSVAGLGVAKIIACCPVLGAPVNLVEPALNQSLPRPPKLLRVMFEGLLQFPYLFVKAPPPGFA